MSWGCCEDIFYSTQDSFPSILYLSQDSCIFGTSVFYSTETIFCLRAQWLIFNTSFKYTSLLTSDRLTNRVDPNTIKRDVCRAIRKAAQRLLRTRNNEYSWKTLPQPRWEHRNRMLHLREDLFYIHKQVISHLLLSYPIELIANTRLSVLIYAHHFWVRKQHTTELL